MKRGFLIIFLLFVFFSHATHNRAGEILYKRVAPFTATVSGIVVPVYNYTFQIHTYTEINSPGGNADRCKLTLHLGDGDSIIVIRANGPAGPSSGDCSGTREGVEVNATTKHNIYVGSYQYANAGIYRVYMFDPNRNGGVENVPNSINQPFYLESLLIINNFTGANSAPAFTSPPLDNACNGICFYHNPGAFDADGDSLSYELTYSRGIDQNGTIGAGIPGYTYPLTGSGGSYEINPISGTLKWCSPQKAGEYNLAFIVREWRKNTAGIYVLIGYVLRDMQVKVIACATNLPPDLIVPPDTCVVAGTLVTKTITVSDPNNGNMIKLYGFGGPFTSTSPLATLSDVFGATSYTTEFSWQTNCGMIRNQPYQVTLKAEDQQAPVKLVVFKSFNIRVVPPAIQNVSATPIGSTIKINWQLSNCFSAANPIVKYEIYRKNDCNPIVFEPCASGPPTNQGYVLTGSTTAVMSEYTDTGNGQSLVVGQDYNYLVVAVYQDGSYSYASSTVCTKLKRDIPILLNADILSTSASTGSVFVRWTRPLTNVGNLDTLVLTGPYTFNLLFKSLSATSYSTIYSVTKPQYHLLNQLTDTTFTHENINTVAGALEYKVEFVAATTTVGASQRATSVFLTATGGERKVKLSWASQTPWSNYNYTIFRRDPSQTTFTSIATTSLTTYTDSINVANRSTYCYYILSEGKYSDASVPGPLFNKSQETCALAEDKTAPCAPTLTITSDCVTGFVGLKWNNVNLSCANDVIKYCLYKKETEESDYVLIDTLYGPASVAYNFDNLPEVAGCFAIAAIDSSGNLGNKSAEVCIDNCPEFELPNIVTINDDGVNDFFKAIRVRHIKEIDLYVYDRWGTLIYTTKDPYFKWDGTSKVSKQRVSDGTLFYLCDVYELRVKGVKKRSLKGFVQIIN
jgi:gliding motility-associated-like protein